MSLLKKLTQMSLVGSLAMSSTGCNIDYESRLYRGNIEGEEVTFERTKKDLLGMDGYTLTVKKSDGRVIRYFDEYSEDLLPESVEITTKEGKVSKYSRGSNNVDDEVMMRASMQFTDYMTKILEIKKSSALAQIK